MLTNPFLLWIAAVTGIDIIWVAIISVPCMLFFGIFMWQSIYMMFLCGATDMRQWSRDARGFVSFIWWMLFAVFVVCAFVMELIISIIAVFAGYSAMKNFRDWWHKEQRR